jgi:hypothetical protein
MRIPYHPMGCFITSMLLLTACQSDSDKLQRLQGDQTMYCLNAQADMREFELASRPLSPPVPSKDSLFGEYMKHKTACDLATRDLNRFMR